MEIKSLDPQGRFIKSVIVDNVADAASFYPTVQGIRYNFVAKSGFATSEVSSRISDSTDRLFLRAIRASSDLIVTTGKTARAENLRGSIYAPLLVITRQDQLEVPATTEPYGQKVYVTNSQQISSNPKCVPIGAVLGEVTSFMESLLKNYPSIVLESGVSFAKSIAKKKLMVEFDLTVVEAGNYASASLTALEIMEVLDVTGIQIQCLNQGTTWLFRFKVLPRT